MGWGGVERVGEGRWLTWVLTLVPTTPCLSAYPSPAPASIPSLPKASLNPSPVPNLRIHCFCLGIYQNSGQREVGSPDVFSLPSWVPSMGSRAAPGYWIKSSGKPLIWGMRETTSLIRRMRLTSAALCSDAAWNPGQDRGFEGVMGRA